MLYGKSIFVTFLIGNSIASPHVALAQSEDANGEIILEYKDDAIIASRCDAQGGCQDQAFTAEEFSEFRSKVLGDVYPKILPTYFLEEKSLRTARELKQHEFDRFNQFRSDVVSGGVALGSVFHIRIIMDAVLDFIVDRVPFAKSERVQPRVGWSHSIQTKNADTVISPIFAGNFDLNIGDRIQFDMVDCESYRVTAMSARSLSERKTGVLVYRDDPKLWGAGRRFTQFHPSSWDDIQSDIAVVLTKLRASTDGVPAPNVEENVCTVNAVRRPVIDCSRLSDTQCVENKDFCGMFRLGRTHRECQNRI